MKILSLSLLVACAPQDTGLTNGPDNGEIVSGSGVMAIDVEEIIISEIQLGYSKSASFNIESIGDSNLQIYEIRITANDVSETFYFPEVEDIELAPAQTAMYTVTANLDVAEPATGMLRLRTNDADAATLNIPLHAWPEGYVPPEDTGGDDSGADSGGGA